MSYVFVAATILFFGLLALKRWEVGHEVQLASTFRERLDRHILNGTAAFERVARLGYGFVRNEIVLRSIHMVTYTALFTVRRVEGKLERITTRIRGSRVRPRRGASEYLSRILGEERHKD